MPARHHRILPLIASSGKRRIIKLRRQLARHVMARRNTAPNPMGGWRLARHLARGKQPFQMGSAL